MFTLIIKTSRQKTQTRVMVFRLMVLSVLACLSVTGAYAQGSSMMGTVKDSLDETPVPGAMVTLRKKADSTLILRAVADINGSFQITGVDSGAWLLKVGSLGYLSYQKRIAVGHHDLNLGILRLVPDSGAVGEVVIHGLAPPMQQHGDTLQYTADAYKTNPDAELEDLLGKLPGMSIENGVIKSNGETIQLILLDGQPYFGGDLATALKNIPADIIAQIQVYDKPSDMAKFTGFDDGLSVKIINIITKKNKRSGEFGQMQAGYGTSNRYNAGGNLNTFQKNRRISLVGNTSNTASGLQGGTSRAWSLGGNFADSLGKKNYLNAGYTYGQNNTGISSSLVRTWLGTGITYTEKDETKNNGNNQNLSLRWQYTPDTLNRLTLNTAFAYGHSQAANATSAQNTAADTLQNQTSQANTSQADNYLLRADLLFGHRFAKKGRTLSVNIYSTIGKNSGTSALNATSMFFNAADSTSRNRQQTTSLARNARLIGTLSYTEPINRHNMLQASYTSAWSQNNSAKQTYDRDTADQAIGFDSLLSSNLATSTFSQRPALAYRYSGPSFHVNIQLALQDELLSGIQQFPNSLSIHKNYIQLLPSVIFNYKISPRSNLNISYRSNTRLPSVFQLENVINNSNPLQVFTGNPNLAQSFVQSLNARYGLPLSTTNSLSLYISAAKTENSISNTSVTAAHDSILPCGYLLHQGARFSMPVNLDGGYTFNAGASVSLQVPRLKNNLGLNGAYSYSAVPVLINNVSGFTYSSGITGNIIFSSGRTENLDYTLTYSPNYSIIHNTVLPLQVSRYLNQGVGLHGNLTLWKSLVLTTELAYNHNSGLSSAYRHDLVTWNMSIGKKFFKKQNGSLNFYVYDLLNQDNSLSHTVTDLYVQDRSASVQGRYYMVTFMYHLQNYR